MKCKVIAEYESECRRIAKELDKCFCNEYDEDPCWKCSIFYKKYFEIETILKAYKILNLE